MSNIIIRLQKAWKALTETNTPETGTQLISQETEFITSENPWQAETALTRLVGDYRNGKTKWVFASDMSELFEKIENFNSGVDDASRINILLHKDVNENLNKTIDEEGHFENMDNIFAHVGPSHVGGLKFTANGSDQDMDYVYNVIESYLLYTDKSGKSHKIQFGMDDAGPLEQALSHAPDLPKLER
tara:strand:+ start:112 stop:672 length:561 start_codon:yes stop_codon:yes gene_type:complete